MQLTSETTRVGDHQPDGALLLYGLLTSLMRRAAWVLTAVALIFGLVGVWAGTRYAALSARADAIEDAALIEGFRISIPDPRPTIQRAQFEVRATAFGGLAVVTGLIAVGAGATALLIRPPKPLARRALGGASARPG